MNSHNPNCELCPLHLKAQSVCVEGRWDSPRVIIPNNVVAFVGQAPSKDEDLKNKPFVGPAGQLLQQAIDEFNLKPAFLTNTVRCFPGRDNKGQDYSPTADQIEACSPYLDQELKKIQPAYIVAVGGPALKALTGKTGITSFAGQIAGEYKGTPVFAMLHPSYILRKKGELPRFEAHAKTLSEILRPSEVQARPRVSELTPQQAKAWLLGLKVTVAYDIETSTKWPWQGGHIRSIAFSDGISGKWVDIEGAGKAGQDFLQWWYESEITKVAHNGQFESVWGLWFFGLVPRGWKWDTLLIAHLVDENGPKGLDMLASRYDGVSGWDIAPMAREKGWVTADGDVDYSIIPIKELGYYNGLDAVYTARLLPLWEKLDAGQRGCYTKILLPLAKLCARMEVRGMHFDTEWAGRAAAKYRQDMVKLEAQMRVTPHVQRLVRGLKKGTELNYRSPKQLSKLLFDIMGLPVGKRTKTGAASTEAVYLERMKNPPPLLTMYLDWKARDTVNNNYLEKLPTFADADGIIRGQTSPAFIVTGRTSVSKPPLHGTPEGVVTAGKSDGLVRGAFDSRFPGGKIISSDYKALEFRLVCSEAEDMAFVKAFCTGLDPHALTAKDLFGPGFTSDDRAKAKITNFSIIYGVTEFSLGPKLGESEEYAARVIIRFKKTHPRIFVWMEKQYETARLKRISVNRFGRVRHLPDIAGMDDWQKREILREAGNFPIQSAGADITNLSAITFDAALRERDMESKLVLIYHDALVVDTHPDEVDLVQELLVNIMEKEVPGSLKWLRLPLQVDVKTADRWGGAIWR